MARPYYSDDKVDEIHWEVQKELKSRKGSPAKNIPTGALIFLIGAAVLALFLGITKNIDTPKLLFMVLIFAAVAFFLGSRNMGYDILTEQQCKGELYHKLKWKQRNPLGMYRELPEGELRIDIKTRLRFFEGRPWKRYSGFSVITNDGLTENFYGVQDPYSGDIIEVNYCPQGFNPAEIQDIVWIASPELMTERRWAEYGGKVK